MVDTTVDATCKSTAAGDSRINLQLCMSQLGHHRESPDADTWGLAKVASLVGVNSVDLAADDIKTLEASHRRRRLPSAPSSTLASASPSPAHRTRLTSESTPPVSRGSPKADASAQDEINKREYAAVVDMVY
ncbi:pectinesterase inhibitor 12-like [Miscanthus floridulus]|uniref:pectinesterase inhibitor 12-like n=1 Tax=Miscanthus floridulus TaxID=154761 RepID=UPI00345A54F9